MVSSCSLSFCTMTCSTPHSCPCTSASFSRASAVAAGEVDPALLAELTELVAAVLSDNPHRALSRVKSARAAIAQAEGGAA